MLQTRLAMNAENTHCDMSILLQELKSRGEEFENQKYITHDIIEKFKKLGVYRALVPKKYGGTEMTPAEFCQLIETISIADGSAGWVASFGMNPFYLGGLPLSTLDEIYRNGPDVVFAGGIFPPQKAMVTDKGFVVSGRWGFASGCMGASLIGVGIMPENGEEKSLPRIAVLPKEQTTIDPVWNTVGLAGTGSHDVVVDNVVVPEEWTFIRGGKLNIQGDLYRYPVLSLATQVLAVVSAGVARAALNEIYTIAGQQRSVTGAPRLADRQFAQRDVAHCEAELNSARSWFYDAIDQVWQTLCRGDAPQDEDVNLLRLSATHLTRVAAKVTSKTLMLAGMPGISMRSPLQRYARDSMVITQHAFMGELTYINAGNMFFGQSPLPGYL